MLFFLRCRMLIASMFDGHIRNIANLEYSIYASFTISSLLELPADLLGTTEFSQSFIILQTDPC